MIPYLEEIKKASGYFPLKIKDIPLAPTDKRWGRMVGKLEAHHGEPPLDYVAHAKRRLKNAPTSSVLHIDTAKGKPAAMAGYAPVNSKLKVFDLYVESKLRGKGIGTVVMDKLKEKLIANKKLKSIELFTAKNNKPANAFYLEQGFKPSKVQPYSKAVRYSWSKKAYDTDAEDWRDRVDKLKARFTTKLNKDPMRGPQVVMRPGYIDFPADEREHLKKRYDSGKGWATTRHGDEKDKYSKGHIVDSPFGKLKVVKVKKFGPDSLKKHPNLKFIKERSDWMASIAKNPYDHVKLQPYLEEIKKANYALKSGPQLTRQLYRIINKIKLRNPGVGSEHPYVSAIDLMTKNLRRLPDEEARNYVRKLAPGFIKDVANADSRSLTNIKDLGPESRFGRQVAKRNLANQELIRQLSSDTAPGKQTTSINLGGARMQSKFRKGKPIPELSGGELWFARTDSETNLGNLTSGLDYLENSARNLERPSGLVVRNTSKYTRPLGHSFGQGFGHIPYDEPAALTAKQTLANPAYMVGQSKQLKEVAKVSPTLSADVEAAKHPFPLGEDPKGWLHYNKQAQLITPEFEKSIIDNYYDSKDPSHGYEGHVLPVRQTAAEIAAARKMDALPMEDLDAAALLHDITRSSDKTDSHHETGSVEAARLLEEQGLQRERIEAIKHMIKNHRASSKIPDDLSEGAKVLRDADRIAEGNPLQRSYNYHLHNITPGNQEAALMGALTHVQHKYHPDTGYGTKALHFDESREKYRKYYDDVMKAYEADEAKTHPSFDTLWQMVGEKARMKKAGSITLDIEKGDTLLGGRFKNIKTIVKDIATDELGQPTINGKKLLSFRIAKNMPAKQQEATMGKQALYIHPEAASAANKLLGKYPQWKHLLVPSTSFAEQLKHFKGLVPDVQHTSFYPSKLTSYLKKLRRGAAFPPDSRYGNGAPQRTPLKLPYHPYMAGTLGPESSNYILYAKRPLSGTNMSGHPIERAPKETYLPAMSHEYNELAIPKNEIIKPNSRYKLTHRHPSVIINERLGLLDPGLSPTLRDYFNQSRAQDWGELGLSSLKTGSYIQGLKAASS